MRITGYYLLLFFAGFTAYGQHYEISLKNKWWKPSQFPEGINKVAAYEFAINKGKIKKDSTLLWSSEYNAAKNRVSGRDRDLNMVSHSYSTTENSTVTYDYFSFEYFFNIKGWLVSDSKLHDREKDYDGPYPFQQNKTKYAYDSLGNVIKEIHYSSQLNYELDEKTGDTLDLNIMTTPSIQLYEYEGGNVVSKYSQTDSTFSKVVIYNLEASSSSTAALYYKPKRKNWSKSYDKDGKLLLTTSYTTDDQFHSKKYYSYDVKMRLESEIDSTGWYQTTIPPYPESKTIYKYTDSEKTVSKEIFKNPFNAGSYSVTTYNNQDLIISECISYGGQKQICDYYEYTYENDKVITMISITEAGKAYYDFEYNESGLLTQELVSVEGKTTYLIKYYYN